MDNSSTHFRHPEKKQINLHAESNVRFGPVSDVKVCNKHGRYGIEVQVQSLFRDQFPVPSSNPRTCRGSTINPALQDNVLLPEGFTKYIYHVGNGKVLRSIVNHGWIPAGVSLKTGRHAVCFTVVNPMDNQDGLGETLCIQKCLDTLSGYSNLVQFEARSTKRTAILSNKIKCSCSLRHTVCRVH